MRLPRHLFSRLLPSLALAVAAFAVSPPAVAQEGNAPAPVTLTQAQVEQVMGRAVDDVIRPGYRTFHGAAQALTKAMATYCAAPSASTEDAAHAAFDEVVRTWSMIEIVRIGPVLSQNRFERILFYPDRKSTGLKQVQALLAKPDEADTEAPALKGKSVAMQGLGALEFVLYGSGAKEALSEKESFRCRYGAAVASNIESIAAELVAEWEKPGGIQDAWKHPGPDNPEFRDGKEAMTALLGILVHGAETVRDQRIETFYKGKDQPVRPKSAIYWRSGNTWKSIDANIAGLQTLFTKSGMEQLLDPGVASIAGSIEFVMKSLTRIGPNIDPDIENAVGDENQRAKIDFLLVNTRDLIVRLNDEYGAAIGMGAGFSFSDGD
ncbi:imelysin family protein [Sinorhizobium sp. BG8]|uniref:imelysin family protein n=1 Tax=Sinorhizobium sp. BG8 TaxID=2613773 RepID=UPI00193D221A|nr:imelysin family protein [Sinorhizobium sp. BG8]QRM53966.1 hypothetical protein F3Y30_04895 [Sinorhizobium sp. BG8]